VDRVELPERLRGVFFDGLWETTKVWRLPTAPQVVMLTDLDWNLDLTVWSTVRGEARWDLSPRMVLEHPARYERHWRRILSVDISFPLEMFRQADRWVVLDGYHRLARHRLEERPEVSVRLHPEECWALIRCEGQTAAQLEVAAAGPIGRSAPSRVRS
jgi:hypothetical protein